MDQTEIELEKGAAYSFNAVILPSNATNRELVWSSSNNISVVVSTSGVITGKEVGEATINVISQDGGGVKSKCKVIVGKPVNTPNITLSQSNIDIVVGKTTYINPILTPIDLQIVYTSDDIAIATVSSSGEITAKSVGVANITIASVSGTSISETIHVTVSKPTDIDEYDDFNSKVYVNNGILYIESDELIDCVQVISFNGVCLKDIKGINQKTFLKDIRRYMGKIVFVRIFYAEKIEVRKVIVH